jgi:hypothetical protein
MPLKGGFCWINGLSVPGAQSAKEPNKQNSSQLGGFCAIRSQGKNYLFGHDNLTFLLGFLQNTFIFTQPISSLAAVGASGRH